jgi:hypothetical protein
VPWICDTERPELRDVAADHCTACHFPERVVAPEAVGT